MSTSPFSSAATCAPSTSRPANGVVAIWSLTRPITPVRRCRSDDAMRLGAYPSCAATSSTRRRVSGATEPRPLSAWETVVAETPAAAATSRIPTRVTRVRQGAGRAWESFGGAGQPPNPSGVP